MGLFPENYRKEIEKDSISGMQNAADKLQWAIVKGLSAIEGVRVSIVNSLYIGSYPRRYRKLMIPTFPFSAFGCVEGKNVGFCNLTGLKQLSRHSTAKKAVAEWARTPCAEGEEKALVIYALTVPFTKIAEFIKKKYPHIKVCVVVPDLPEYMRNGKEKEKFFYKVTKKESIRYIRRNLRDVDCYVLLTDTMKEWFKKPVKYTVVEGIAGAISETEETLVREKRIVYAGGISEAYGVVDLVKSFVRIDAPDWELVLYGDGNSMKVVQNLAADHPNVKVMGMRPNQEVVAMQKKASILINPRKNQIFTRYSFPSKILEYMSSGTAVMAYKLDGMPAEYDPYYYSISEEENGLEKSLRMVMALTEEERCQMGERARKFVAENKDPVSQCAKIVKLLAEV
jgi:glycosyltransferase involved in cell wall biosynthesis